MAPDFRLTAFDGTPVRLADHLGRGRMVLIVFWSYFCFPCQRELPEVARMAADLKDRVTVLGICLDGPEYDDKVLPFIRSHKITFPNAYDRPNHDFFEVAERYGVIGTPTFFLVDPQGKIRFVHLGRLPVPVLSKVIEAAKENAYCPELLPPAKP